MAVEFVRVRIGDREATISSAWAKSSGAEVIDDAPAVDRDGRPLPTTRRKGRPVKPKTAVATKAAGSKTVEAPADAETAEEASS